MTFVTWLTVYNRVKRITILSAKDLPLSPSTASSHSGRKRWWQSSASDNIITSDVCPDPRINLTIPPSCLLALFVLVIYLELVFVELWSGRRNYITGLCKYLVRKVLADGVTLSKGRLIPACIFENDRGIVICQVMREIIWRSDLP